MQIISSLSEKVLVDKPVALTIGKFDGLHLGHQAVLDRVKALAGQNNRKMAVLTFTNNPQEVLNPDQPINLIYTLSHKIKLLKEAQVDFLFLIPFTKELSQLTAEDFLRQVQKNIPFDYLILGRHDTTLGKNKQGNVEQLQTVSERLSFHLEFIGEKNHGNPSISSSYIKQLISKGNLVEAEKLLGRKYSIFAEVIQSKTDRANGTNTLTIDASNLSLPPAGSYSTDVHINDVEVKGITRITNSENRAKVEVDCSLNQKIYPQFVEVIFSSIPNEFDGICSLV